MKLKQWADQQGIAYITAWRWCKNNKMPCAWEQTPSGTILVHPETEQADESDATYIYARVSSHGQKENLQRQVARCESFCEARGWEVSKVFKEIASGMNDNRRRFWKMLNEPPGRIVIEYKDRLTRFGFNYLSTLLPRLGWKLVIIHQDTQDKDDLLKDLVSIITSFCCRLYGLRRGQAKAKTLREQCEEPAN